MIIITETRSDDSGVNLPIPGVRSVARRDRSKDTSEKPHGGGVAVHVREHGPVISHIADSDAAERTWCTIHTDVGPVLLGAAYRAGDVPIDDSLDEELAQHGEGMIDILSFGDFNVHIRPLEELLH